MIRFVFVSTVVTIETIELFHLFQCIASVFTHVDTKTIKAFH